MAEQGDLLIELDHFISVLQNSRFFNHDLSGKFESLMITFFTVDEEAHDLIDLAEDEGIVHKTKRNFAKMRTLCFVSL